MHAIPLLSDLPSIRHGPLVALGELGRLEVHLWRHDHSAGIERERMSALLAVLSPEEHTRFRRLRDDQRRQQFVVGRALCRHVLSRYAPVAPQDWRFTLGHRGKPLIATPVLRSPLWFNLSHTDGTSLCAVTRTGPDIGIDIEQIDLARDPLDIAEQFFPKAELDTLRHLSTAQRAETFTQLWALKEAFVKARETSLADGISGATFDLTGPDSISVTFNTPLRERAQDWQFTVFRLDRARIVALVVKTHTSGPLTLRADLNPPSQCFERFGRGRG